MKESQPKKPARLASLDALRGFDMFFIMGGSGLLFALASLFPESAFWNAVAQQMNHAAWDGLTHHDTIFPLFLFIAGVSFPFSLANQLSKGMSRAAIYAKIFRRGLTLCLLGVVYNGFLALELDTFRVCSVLGRIGLAWMLAALLYVVTFDARRPLKHLPLLLGVMVALLVGYWLVTLFIPAPDAGGSSVFEAQGNIACWIDRTLLGAHSYSPLYDPEGLLSTLPAVATALLGMLSGVWLKLEHPSLTPGRKSLALFACGVAFALIGFAWDVVYPINKALWSSSFVCAVGGYSLIMLAVFHFVIDVCGFKGWSFFFIVIGLNSITIYLLQQFVAVWHTERLLFSGFVGLLPERYHALGHWAAYVLLCWLVLHALYKKKIFLKV